MYCMRWASGKETSWPQTFGSWKILHASEIHARRLNAKEVLMPQNVEKSYSLLQMEQSSCLEKNQVFRRSTSIRDHPARGEEYNDVLQGESDGSQPLDTDDGEARNYFWTIAGNFFIVITLNQELNSMCRLKNHSQYHSSALTLSGGRTRHWMCCWRAVLTIIGTSTVAGNHGPVSRSSEY